MTREIKFRAWDKKDKVIREVVGMSFYHDSVSVDIEHGKYLQDDTKRFELMQYAGLVDKNGTEIYEGDVVKVIVPDHDFVAQGDGWMDVDRIDGYQLKGVVKFEHSMWFVDHERYAQPLYMEPDNVTEVIGNIHDHPHLLGGVDK